MKKLLILLMCGFAFTQSIQTRQIEVNVSDLSGINLFENSELIGEKYFIQPVAFESFNTSLVCDMIVDGTYPGVDDDNFDIIFYDEYTSTVNSHALSDALGNSSLSFNCSNDVSYPIIQSMFITSDFPNIMIANNHLSFGEIILGYLENVTFTFWVTGLFEDEGVGLQGDINDDENVDIVDVIALVNIILE